MLCFCPRRIHGTLFDKAVEVHCVSIEPNLEEGELRERLAAHVLRPPGIESERDLRTSEGYLGRHVVQDGGVVAVVINLAIVRIFIASQRPNLLRAVIVVPEADIVNDLVGDGVERLVGHTVNIHDGGHRIFKVAAVSLRVESHVLYRINIIFRISKDGQPR